MTWKPDFKFKLKVEQNYLKIKSAKTLKSNILPRVPKGPFCIKKHPERTRSEGPRG